MRVLILSCNTGQGHNSCAGALKEVFDAKGHYCVVEDALSYVSKATSALIAKGHTFVYRHFPRLFRFGYRFAERHPGCYHSDSALYRYFCSSRQRLARSIDSGEFDAVICTHVVAAVLLTEARKLCTNPFHTAFVATDYTCSPTTEESELDTYFIPDVTLKNEFEEYGIPAEKLIAAGIPVRQMFYQSSSKAEAKQAQGIDPAHRHLLLMCGSMGCGPMDSLVFLFSKLLQPDEELTVVCGTNKRLEKKLQKRCQHVKNIHIRGYGSDMSLLMDSADLCLTKPGGISVTEAAQKHLPMVLVDAVAGCEEYNRRFFMNRGCAVSAKNSISLVRRCAALLRDDSALSEMESSFAPLTQHNTAQWIYEYLNCQILYRNSDTHTMHEKRRLHNGTEQNAAMQKT